MLGLMNSHARASPPSYLEPKTAMEHLTLVTITELPAEVQSKLQKAAQAAGKSLDEYVLAAAIEKANRPVIDEDEGGEFGDDLERITLSPEDWDLVQKALADPFDNDRMRETKRIAREMREEHARRTASQ